MERKWEEMGISWSTEVVNGDNGAGSAQIPIPMDLTKIVSHFGEQAILGTLDGTSWRVAAQDVSRRWNAKNSGVTVTLRVVKPEAVAAAQREAVYNRLMGVRLVSRAAVQTIVVKVHMYNLPDGSEFTPDATDSEEIQLTNLRAAWVAAMIDLDTGMEAETLIAMSAKVQLKK